MAHFHFQRPLKEMAHFQRQKKLQRLAQLPRSDPGPQQGIPCAKTAGAEQQQDKNHLQ
jgi:hypothetical protein